MRFFFNDTATTEIYTLSLHDALPISRPEGARRGAPGEGGARRLLRRPAHPAALRVRVLAAAGRAEDRQALRGILRLHPGGPFRDGPPERRPRHGGDAAAAGALGAKDLDAQGEIGRA